MTQHKHMFSHGIMYHHFHSKNHYKSQGSICKDDFEASLNWLASNYSLLSADIYQRKYRAGTLNPNDICLTFDDSLKSQFDIALPVMKARNIKAFFFVYSGPLLGEPNFLEVFRYYRSTQYKSIGDFYVVFFEQAKVSLGKLYNLEFQKFEDCNHLKDFDFYTNEDRWFRYLRDHSLADKLYKEIMLTLMKKDSFSPASCCKHLWMSEEDLKELHKQGHLIGLHSFSHPTMMETLSRAEQQLEYDKNFQHLSATLKSAPESMSHPCGKYNAHTSKILEDLNILIGFRSDMLTIKDASIYEVPRQDHANIMRFIKEEKRS